VPFLNVKDYGAVGDGVTNDTPAINAAIAAYKSGNSAVNRIHFPKGNYVVNSAVDLGGTTGLILSGEGPATSYFTSTAAINAAFIATTATSTLQFQDLGWVGNVNTPNTVPTRTRTTTGSSFQHAVQLDGSLVPTETNPVITDVSFLRCKVSNCASLPIFFRGLSGRTKVVDSHFENNLDVGLIYCADVRVVNNTANNSADNGFSISRGNRKAVIIGNKVNGAAYHGLWVSGFVIDAGGGTPGSGSDTGPQDFAVTGNVVTSCGRSGIALIDAPKWGVVTGNTVDGVIRGDLSSPNDNYGLGILIQGYPDTLPGAPTDYAEGLSINNNTLLNCDRGGIFLKSAVRNSKVSDNLIINCGSQFMADGTTSLVNNSTDNLNNFGISADNITTHSNLEVNNNLVIESRAGQYMNWSVSVSTTISGARMAGNRGINTYDVRRGSNPSESFDTWYGAKTIAALFTATAGIRVGSTAGTSNLFARIDGAAGNARRFVIGTGNQVDRWAWTGNGTTESGSNVGTDLELRAYNDAGSLLFTPLTFTRSNGLTTFGRAVAFTTQSQTLASAGTVSIDARAGNITITLQANATSTSIINPATGQQLTITWLQDATGSRTYVWPANCKFAGAAAPTATTTANRRDRVTFEYDGTNWQEVSRAINVG
jgi:hypothetical protein